MYRRRFPHQTMSCPWLNLNELDTARRVAQRCRVRLHVQRIARSGGMVSAHDVAAYILMEHGPLSAMKLQKLVYYSQAWSLVWDDRQLFREPVEAWANGPVVRELYERHRGQFELHEWPWGNAAVL